MLPRSALGISMIRQLAPGYAQGLTSAKGYPRFSDPELALTPRAISLATRRVELALAMCVPARPTASRTYQSEDGGGARREPRRIILLKNSSQDRKSTRLNSSHARISYAVFCLTGVQTCALPI